MNWERAEYLPEKNAYHIPSSWVYVHFYEAFNLLFRIENALRVFVYIVLKNELKDKWGTVQVVGDDAEGTIVSIAKRRMSQSQSFGYLGHSVICPIMHLTSGEMTRLITSDAYWKLFKPYFLGSKEIIKNKLEEIGSIRNSLAHFRPIKADDVDAIKQNSKHVLLGVEQFLGQVLAQPNVIPTNTEETWYKQLNTLGTDLCKLNFRQSNDEKWVRLSMWYKCPTLKTEMQHRHYVRYNVLTIKSSAILINYPPLAHNTTYLVEFVPFPRVVEHYEHDTAAFRKAIIFVFARRTVADGYEQIKTAFEELLRTISEETELIQQDNLARGKIIHSIVTTSSATQAQSGSTYWTWHPEHLKTPVQSADPPEYWGRLDFLMGDFIATTTEYPWMPEPICEEEEPPF